jgi:hypothetical protein
MLDRGDHGGGRHGEDPGVVVRHCREHRHKLVACLGFGGFRIVRPVEMQFHGDLMAEPEDPLGHSWFFASRVQDMSLDELQQSALAALTRDVARLSCCAA